MGKVIRRHSEAFKRSVVAEVESGRYTVLETAAFHQIHFSTVYLWLKQRVRELCKVSRLNLTLQASTTPKIN